MADLMEAVKVGLNLLSQVSLFVLSVLLFHCSYNKRDLDFTSPREYNDYLEQVEDIGRNTSLRTSCRN